MPERRTTERRKDGEKNKPVTKGEHDKKHKQLLYAGVGGTALLLLVFLWWRNNNSSSSASTGTAGAGPAGVTGTGGIIESLTGPTGARGPAGARGPTGKTGPRGVKGTTIKEEGKAGIAANPSNVTHVSRGRGFSSGGTGPKSGTIATHKSQRFNVPVQVVNEQGRNKYGYRP